MLSMSFGGLCLTLNRASYTASIGSSAFDYPVEHGRRYHAYRQGRMSKLPFMSIRDDAELVRIFVTQRRN